MSWWDRWLWELGFAVCHQQPERMLRFGQKPLFVCSRDTGLFVSFFTVLLVLSLLRARERAGMPPLPIMALAACGLLFLAVDGLTSYLGWRETTNTIRFLSGFAAGGGLAFPAAAMLNRYVFAGDRSLRVGSRWKDILSACAAGGAAAFLYLWRPQVLYRPAQLWLLLCLLGTFWALNLMLIDTLREREGGGFTWTRAATAALLAAAELCGAYFLHRAAQGRGPLPPAARKRE